MRNLHKPRTAQHVKAVKFEMNLREDILKVGKETIPVFNTSEYVEIMTLPGRSHVLYILGEMEDFATGDSVRMCLRKDGQLVWESSPQPSGSGRSTPIAMVPEGVEADSVGIKITPKGNESSLRGRIALATLFITRGQAHLVL